MITPTAPRAARRLLRLTAATIIFTVFIGTLWDGYWHVTQPFDGFWSPPHVFVYLMSSVAGVIAATLVLRPGLRAAFGPATPIAPVPFAIPGGLYLLCGGFVALGVGGMLLDNLWHTAFGLNETSWSLPHAMIGGALAAIACGIAAARLTLREALPLGRLSWLLLGLILLGCSRTFLGPLDQYNTSAVALALARIPTLAAQPGARQTTALVLAWNLTRSNPALLLLGALWAGLAIGLLRTLDARPRYALLVVLLWTLSTLNQERNGARWLGQYLPLLADPAAWLPLPLLPAALAHWLAARRWSDRTALALAGWVFAGLTLLIWHTPLGWGLPLWALAGPAAVAGGRVGAAAGRTLLEPGATRAQALLWSLALGVPLLTGAVDLALRRLTLPQ